MSLLPKVCICWVDDDEGLNGLGYSNTSSDVKWSNSFTCLNRINSSTDPLQNNERFGNGIYTVICGNHSVTVIQSPQSRSNTHKTKKIHIKHLYLWSNPSLYPAWVVSFKTSLCCLCREAISSSAGSYCNTREKQFSSISVYFWGEPKTNHQVGW